MKPLSSVFILLICLCCCHRPDKNKVRTSQATDVAGVVSNRPGSDTGISAAPEMLMLQNNRGDLVLFCVYGAELVVAVPAKKKGLAEIVTNPKPIESITARSGVK